MAGCNRLPHSAHPAAVLNGDVALPVCMRRKSDAPAFILPTVNDVYLFVRCTQRFLPRALLVHVCVCGFIEGVLGVRGHIDWAGAGSY